MMKSKEINFEHDGVTAHIVVREADVMIGARRTRLGMEGRSIEEDDKDRKIVRLFIYPDLMAAATTIEISGIDGAPDFEQFLRLPETLALEWESATFELNPHWLPQDTDEKKASN